MSAYPHGSTLRTGLSLALAAVLPLAHAAVHRQASHGTARAAQTSAHREATARSTPRAHNAAPSRPGPKTVAAKHSSPASQKVVLTAHGKANAHRAGSKALTGRSDSRARPAAVLARENEPPLNGRRSGRMEPKQQGAQHVANTAPAAARLPGTATAAEQATADRVHAWYRSRQAAAAEITQAAVPEEKPAATSTAPQATAPQRSAEIKPDLSPVPQKATLADFDRALKKQTETVRKTATVDASRTSTADDEAAFVEQSHIPSTAPTERVAAPFTHGEMLRPAGTAAAVAATVTPKATPPAVRLTTNAAVKPIDPGVMKGLAEETFADDASPSTAASAAVALAAAGTRPTVTVKPASAPAPTPEALETDLPAIARVQVKLYDSVGKLVVPPPMRGTHEILVHQNQMAVADGLDRIEDDFQMADMRRRKLLVALPNDSAATVDDRLPMNRRYARPWSVRFLTDLSRAHYARFGTPLIVTSAARTVAFQRRLIRTNANAAPPSGNIASPHLYGQALDIAKHGMSLTEIAWMRAYLTPVEDDGKIDVEEEFQQACFHISVYRRYLGAPSQKLEPQPGTTPSRTLEQVKAAPAPSRRRHLPAILATGLR